MQSKGNSQKEVVIIARVIGNVVASQKQESHEGKKILLVQPLDLDDQPIGDLWSPSTQWMRVSATVFLPYRKVFRR